MKSVRQKITLDLPEFANIEEERKWWDTHHKEINEFISKASKAGAFTLGPVALARTREQTTQTTIRLLSRDVERAKLNAEKKGLRYQSYLRMLVHQALDSEERTEKAG